MRSWRRNDAVDRSSSEEDKNGDKEYFLKKLERFDGVAEAFNEHVRKLDDNRVTVTVVVIDCVEIDDDKDD